jgi:hypothetical protein
METNRNNEDRNRMDQNNPNFQDREGMNAGSRQSENENWNEESREAEGGWNAASRNEMDYQNQDRRAGSRSEFGEESLEDESMEMGGRGTGSRDMDTESGRSGSREENMRDQSDMGTP